MNEPPNKSVRLVGPPDFDGTRELVGRTGYLVDSIAAPWHEDSLLYRIRLDGRTSDDHLRWCVLVRRNEYEWINDKDRLLPTCALYLEDEQ